MIAVSPPSDPTGAWDKWAIDADLDNNVSADFPGLGVDAFNVYVTANMYNGAVAQYSKVWVIPKAQLLTNPGPTITWFEFPDPPGSDFTMQPAHTFGTPGAEYFLFEGLINRLGVAWMDNVSGTPVWHPPLQVLVTPYTSTSIPAGSPPVGRRQPDRHVGHPPPERGVPERLVVDGPHRVRPSHDQDGSRLVPDRSRRRGGPGAGTDQRPDPLVLLPFHRGQPGRRRRDRVHRILDRPNTSGGITPSSGQPPERQTR